MFELGMERRGEDIATTLGPKSLTEGKRVYHWTTAPDVSPVGRGTVTSRLSDKPTDDDIVLTLPGVYTQAGRVVRTVAMGDDALPAIDKSQAAEEETALETPKTPKVPNKAPKTPKVPNKAPKTPKVPKTPKAAKMSPREAADADLRIALRPHIGKLADTVELTTRLRRVARDVIAERAMIQTYCGEK